MPSTFKDQTIFLTEIKSIKLSLKIIADDDFGFSPHLDHIIADDVVGRTLVRRGV